MKASMLRRPLVLLPLLAALVAAVVTGCGSGGALSFDPVAAAATKTAAEQTFKVEYSMDMTMMGQKMSFGGSGAFDGDRNVAQMSVDLSKLPLPSGATGTATIVFAGGVMYMKMPFLSSQVPNGKPWVKLDLRAAAKSVGVDLGSFGAVDPKQGLQQLLASGDVKKVGTDTIGGVETTHYHAVVDTARMAKVPAPQRRKLRQLLKGMDGSAPVDVWIDGDGRVRRESMSFDYGAGLQSTQASMTMDFTDFGSPVDVTVPAADEVTDLQSLLGQAHRSPTS
jgi:predicted small lipoprotein YifL